MCSGRSSNMWFSLLLSKRILLREEKQCTCFSYLAEPETTLDFRHKEICSIQCRSEGLLLFLFQLFWIWHTFLKRKCWQQSINSSTKGSSLLQLAGRRDSVLTDKRNFLAEEWWGPGHTLCLRITDKYFHVEARLKKNTCHWRQEMLWMFKVEN